MNSHRSTRALVKTAALGAITAVLLSGCAGSAHMARLDQGVPQAEAKARTANDKAIVRFERQVERNPNNAALRTELGVAYLNAGRFDSANTALTDAMRLGDNNARTALSLALAKIGTGHNREAVALLDDWRNSIPASDFGLALALAGETGRGVAVLADALRGGENTPKLRQNLAYAYALDGRWREARTMAEQDVPADKLDARISEWAMHAKPGDYQTRVAGLLGAPVREDPGQPQQLALNSGAPAGQLAAQPQPAEVPVSANTEVAPVAEPVAQSAPAVAMEVPAASEPAPQVPQPTAAEPGALASSSFANAFAVPVFNPPAAKQDRWDHAVPATLPATKTAAQRTGSHLVQLGSFSSEKGARRAWGIYMAQNRSLRDYHLVITPAVVNGRNFWRVAAGGFNARAAVSLCSTVRSRGGGCFAYSANHAPAGAVPASSPRVAGPQMARRR